MSRYFIDLNINSFQVFKEGSYDRPKSVIINDQKISVFNNTFKVNALTWDVFLEPMGYAFEKNNFGLFEDRSYSYGNYISLSEKIQALYEFLFEKLLKTKNCEIVILLEEAVIEILNPSETNLIYMYAIEKFFLEEIEKYNNIKLSKIKLKGCVRKHLAMALCNQYIAGKLKRNILLLTDQSFSYSELDKVHKIIKNRGRTWRMDYRVELLSSIFKIDVGENNPFVISTPHSHVVLPINQSFKIEYETQSTQKVCAKNISHNQSIRIDGLEVTGVYKDSTIVGLYYEGYENYYLDYISIDVVDEENQIISFDNANKYEVEAGSEINIVWNDDIVLNKFFSYDPEYLDMKTDKVLAISPGVTCLIQKKFEYRYLNDLKNLGLLSKIKIDELNLTKNQNFHLINFIFEEIIRNANIDQESPIEFIFQEEKILIDPTEIVNVYINRVKEEVESLVEIINNEGININTTKSVFIFQNKHLKSLVEDLLNSYNISTINEKLYKDVNETIFEYINAVIDFNKVDDCRTQKSVLLKRYGFNDYLNYKDDFYDSIRCYYLHDFLSDNELKKLFKKMWIIK